MTRYPLAPLLAVTGWTLADVRRVAPCNGEEYRLRRELGVTEATADRLAVVAGLHPLCLWPELQREAEVECARPDCATRFVPRLRGHVFCSKRCSRREWERAQYRSNPRFVEAKRRSSARYYEEAGEYVRARERRKYHARRAA